MAGEFDEWVVGLAEEAAEELTRRAPSVFDVSRMLAVVVSEDNALLFLQNRIYHRSENKELVLVLWQGEYLAWEGEGVLKPWSIPGVATTRLFDKSIRLESHKRKGEPPLRSVDWRCREARLLPA